MAGYAIYRDDALRGQKKAPTAQTSRAARTAQRPPRLVRVDPATQALAGPGGRVPYGLAREHYHLDDQVVYILEGTGVVHRGGEPDTPSSQATCVQAPARLVHRVEAVGNERPQALGVLDRPGTAAEVYHLDDG